mgnify:CR=1 FL=1
MSRPLSVILRVHEHSRDSEGMRYVYPVVSRRARGVSVGINLNPNNACNWRCIYCQVPDLQRGGPPPIDLDRMVGELDSLLRDIRTGDFLDRRVADAGMRRRHQQKQQPEADKFIERFHCLSSSSPNLAKFCAAHFYKAFLRLIESLQPGKLRRDNGNTAD